MSAGDYEAQEAYKAQVRARIEAMGKALEKLSQQLDKLQQASVLAQRTVAGLQLEYGNLVRTTGPGPYIGHGGGS